jgi:hypothetical protein
VRGCWLTQSMLSRRFGQLHAKYCGQVDWGWTLQMRRKMREAVHFLLRVDKFCHREFVNQREGLLPHECMIACGQL